MDGSSSNSAYQTTTPEDDEELYDWQDEEEFIMPKTEEEWRLLSAECPDFSEPLVMPDYLPEEMKVWEGKLHTLGQERAELRARKKKIEEEVAGRKRWIADAKQQIKHKQKWIADAKKQIKEKEKCNYDAWFELANGETHSQIEENKKAIKKYNRWIKQTKELYPHEFP